MRKTSLVAILGVTLSLGVMVGLDAHVDRNSAKGTYSSYLAASQALSVALATSNQLESQLASVEKQRNVLLEASGHDATGQAALQAELNQLEQMAGLTELVGPGITVSINYDPALPLIPGLRYVDEATQLQMVVNYLQAAGAKGIAINGQRLVTTSAIRSILSFNDVPGPFSGVIEVNDLPVKAPYVISVVGPVDNLVNTLDAESIGQQFNILDQSFIVQPFFAYDGVHLPAYNGALPNQIAQEGGI